MPEEVLFEVESTRTRGEIASFLRTVADNLEAGEPISFSSGDQSLTVEPPARPTFEIKVERETSASSGRSELGVEFELEWDEDGGASHDISIE